MCTGTLLFSSPPLLSPPLSSPPLPSFPPLHSLPEHVPVPDNHRGYHNLSRCLSFRCYYCHWSHLCLCWHCLLQPSSPRGGNWLQGGGEGREEGWEGSGGKGRGGGGEGRRGEGRKQRRGKGRGNGRLTSHAWMAMIMMPWWLITCVYLCLSVYTCMLCLYYIQCIYCVYSIQVRQCPEQSLVNKRFTSAPILNCEVYWILSFSSLLPPPTHTHPPPHQTLSFSLLCIYMPSLVNFNDIFASLSSVIRVMTGEDWHHLLGDTMVSHRFLSLLSTLLLILMCVGQISGSIYIYYCRAP